MSSHSRTPLFSLLLVALGLSGCQIDFEAETMVEPDGTVTRTSRYVADAVDRDELETSYTLPSGGAWTTQTTMRYNPAAKKDTEVTRHTYSVTKRYRAGDAIPPDHVRRGKTEGRVVR